MPKYVGEKTRPLTADEKRAIAALKRLAKNWPNTLWLFSASGRLCVMQRDTEGRRAECRRGYVDPAYLLDIINIPNDGGDW